MELRKQSKKGSRMLIWRLILGMFLVGVSMFLNAEDDALVILSPHRKSIQDEFVPRFVQYYKRTYKKNVNVDWIDQGGSENEIRYLLSKYDKNKNTANVDLFWGGGDANFIDLENHYKLLETFNLPKSLDAIPQNIIGVPLRSPKNQWYGTALSSFGLFFNKTILRTLKLPEPALWEDLGKSEYFNQISAADPRRSSTALLMSLIILETCGWKKGWEVLFAFSGNTLSFTQSSSDPIKAVVNGQAAIAPAIDFYAAAKVSELGSDKLGFTRPVGETVFNSDPIAILKGAPHKTVAERFIEFLLSEEGQRIYILEKGSKGGPIQNTLARMGVNPLAYKNLDKDQKLAADNLFDYHGEQKQVDFDKLARSKKVLGDLIGAMHMDTHSQLKKAWELARKNPKLLEELAKPPFEEKDLEGLVKQWDNNIFRNQKINAWIEIAQKKYSKVAI